MAKRQKRDKEREVGEGFLKEGRGRQRMCFDKKNIKNKFILRLTYLNENKINKIL